MRDHDQSYDRSGSPAPRTKALPRSARMSRCERERRARLFDDVVDKRKITNGQIARRLRVTESYVRQLRAGERALDDVYLEALGDLGDVVLEQLRGAA